MKPHRSTMSKRNKWHCLLIILAILGPADANEHQNGTDEFQPNGDGKKEEGKGILYFRPDRSIKKKSRTAADTAVVLDGMLKTCSYVFPYVSKPYTIELDRSLEIQSLALIFNKPYVLNKDLKISVSVSRSKRNPPQTFETCKPYDSGNLSVMTFDCKSDILLGKYIAVYIEALSSDGIGFCEIQIYNDEKIQCQGTDECYAQEKKCANVTNNLKTDCLNSIRPCCKKVEAEITENAPRCPLPPLIPNTTTNFLDGGTLVGNRVEYVCNSGYAPQNAASSVIECLAAGNWNITTFFCVFISTGADPYFNALSFFAGASITLAITFGLVCLIARYYQQEKKSKRMVRTGAIRRRKGRTSAHSHSSEQNDTFQFAPSSVRESWRASAEADLEAAELEGFPDGPARMLESPEPPIFETVVFPKKHHPDTVINIEFFKETKVHDTRF